MTMASVNAAGKLLDRAEDRADALGVLGDVLWDLVGGWMPWDMFSRALYPDDVAADVGDVETQSNVGVGVEVAQLRFAGLAVDQDAVVARIRNHTGTESGRPAGLTVVSQAIRFVCSRVSTWVRRSGGSALVISIWNTSCPSSRTITNDETVCRRSQRDARR